MEFSRRPVEGEIVGACGREFESRVTGLDGRDVVELRRVSCLDAVGMVCWMGRRVPMKDGAAGFKSPRDLTARVDMAELICIFREWVNVN